MSAGVPLGLRRFRFTREQVDRMLETDIFAGQRFELIGGELLDKSGQSPPHAHTIQRMMVFLATLFDLNLVCVQMPIEAGPRDSQRSQPEPDLAVIALLNPEHGRRHPRGDELLLAIEVSDTSVDFDLSAKRTCMPPPGGRNTGCST